MFPSPVLPTPAVSQRVTLRLSGSNLFLVGWITDVLARSSKTSPWSMVFVRIEAPAIYAGEYQAFWFARAPDAIEWRQVQSFPAMMRNACFPRP